MASCGPPPRAATTPAAAVEQQQHVLLQHPALLQHPVLLQYTLMQHPLSSKDNASTSGDIFRRYSSCSPHPRFDIETQEAKRRCNFRSEDVPYLGVRH